MISAPIINPHHHELYVDIDAIFDTRLACLEELDVNLALVNLQNGWDRRIADAPLGITEQEFKDLYAVRDANTLSIAVQTPVIEIMRHWLLDAIKQLGEIPLETSLGLSINFFPYRLSKETALDVAEKIRKALKVNIPIDVLFVDPKTITPQVVRQKYDGMIMYDGFKWIKSQEEAFAAVNCPHTTLYVPRFFPDHLPTTEEMTNIRQESKDLFKDMEVNMGPLVALEFLPMHIFSSVVHPKLAELALLQKGENA